MSTDTGIDTARKAERCPVCCLNTLPVPVPSIISDDMLIMHHSGVVFLSNTHRCHATIVRSRAVSSMTSQGLDPTYSQHGPHHHQACSGLKKLVWARQLLTERSIQVEYWVLMEKERAAEPAVLYGAYRMTLAVFDILEFYYSCYQNHITI